MEELNISNWDFGSVSAEAERTTSAIVKQAVAELALKEEWHECSTTRLV